MVTAWPRVADPGSDVWEVPDGRAVPEFPQRGLLFVGEDAVTQGVADVLGPAVGDGLGDLVLGSPGRNGPEDAVQGGLAGSGGPGGQMDHLPDAVGVEVTAVGCCLRRNPALVPQCRQVAIW